MVNDLDTARWMVNWKARTMTADRKLVEAVVCEVMKGGFAIRYPYSLAIGSQLNIEFFVNFQEKQNRIRAKTKVTYCQLASNGQSALIDLKITQASSSEIHLLNNVLMAFVDSNQIDLRVTRDVKPTGFH